MYYKDVPKRVCHVAEMFDFAASCILIHSMLWPSPTVLNLLPNEDECKMFEIRSHSSLSEGQMHQQQKISLAWLKVRK